MKRKKEQNIEDVLNLENEPLETAPIIAKLHKDIKNFVLGMTKTECRTLVDFYYNFQKTRIRSQLQITAHAKALDTQSEEVLAWILKNANSLENQVKKILDVYTNNHDITLWMKSICGIGPVISAGFFSTIELDKTHNVGSIWKFAGLAPGVKWEKGEVRPWNARLKTLCYKLGESFVKVQSNKNDIYGKIYVERKNQEKTNNEAGKYKELAEAHLKEKRYGKDTNAYKAYAEGKLPDAEIHARARRSAVKLFLSHLYDVWHFMERGSLPTLPYSYTIQGHEYSSYIEAPFSSSIPGLHEAVVKRGRAYKESKGL